MHFNIVTIICNLFMSLMGFRLYHPIRKGEMIFISGQGSNKV
jgi:hypothetical protein